jgi:hypothetical protein
MKFVTLAQVETIVDGKYVTIKSGSCVDLDEDTAKEMSGALREFRNEKDFPDGNDEHLEDGAGVSAKPIPAKTLLDLNRLPPGSPRGAIRRRLDLQDARVARATEAKNAVADKEKQSAEDDAKAKKEAEAKLEAGEKAKAELEAKTVADKKAAAARELV